MFPTVAGIVLAIGLAGCGDDPLHADWDQLSFPGDVVVTAPVEVPNGITVGFEQFAVATSTGGLPPKALTREIRLALADQNWTISGRGDIRPGFWASAPDSDDGVEVSPLWKLEHYKRRKPLYDTGPVRDLIESTPSSRQAVLIHLHPPGPDYE